MLSWIKTLLRRWRLRQRFPMSTIHYGATADINSSLEPFSVLFKDTVLLHTTLGRYSYVQQGSVLDHAIIGPFCSIAGNVHIGLASHPMDMVSTSPVFYDNTQPLPRFFAQTKHSEHPMATTTVHADVWIGQGAMIKSGVTIGVGAVVGAGAVVTKDIAPYSIVAGVPACEIKKRFDAENIRRLLDSRWWEMSEEKLAELAPFFGNPHQFLDRLER